MKIIQKIIAKVQRKPRPVRYEQLLFPFQEAYLSQREISFIEELQRFRLEHCGKTK